MKVKSVQPVPWMHFAYRFWRPGYLRRLRNVKVIMGQSLSFTKGDIWKQEK